MTKEKQTPKAKPVYKTLTVNYDQKARTYSVYDESGKEYTAEGETLLVSRQYFKNIT